KRLSFLAQSYPCIRIIRLPAGCSMNEEMGKALSAFSQLQALDVHRLDNSKGMRGIKELPNLKRLVEFPPVTSSQVRYRTFQTMEFSSQERALIVAKSAVTGLPPFSFHTEKGFRIDNKALQEIVAFCPQLSSLHVDHSIWERLDFSQIGKLQCLECLTIERRIVPAQLDLFHSGYS